MTAAAVAIAQHAADHDVARTQRDLLGIGQRAQPHLPVDRPLSPTTELVGALQREGELSRPAKPRLGTMLDLRTLDPARQSADRRVALVAGFGAVVVCTLAAVTSGGGGWALAIGGALALAGLPWFFAFGARWRLLDDALDGVPFVWRGDRSGVWATAPVAGALATLVLVAALGFPRFLALLACLAGAAAYTALLASPRPATNERSCSTSPSSSSASTASPNPRRLLGVRPRNSNARRRAKSNC